MTGETRTSIQRCGARTVFILTGPGADNNLKILYRFKQDSTGVYVDNFRTDCN